MGVKGSRADAVAVHREGPTGKNNGSVKGERYFQCKENHGVFVRPSQVKILEAPPAAPAPAKAAPPTVCSPLTPDSWTESGIPHLTHQTASCWDYATPSHARRWCSHVIDFNYSRLIASETRGGVDFSSSRSWSWAFHAPSHRFPELCSFCGWITPHHFPQTICECRASIHRCRGCCETPKRCGQYHQAASFCR
jgi:hypothetical protein